VKGGWLVGVVGVVVLAYITLNTLRTESVGSRGPQAGTRLPPFAMPLASSRSDADANIATRPDSGPEGSRPACTVRGAEILNVCELAERGPVVLAFLVARSGRCEAQVDVLDALAPRHPRVRFAAVAVRGDHDELRETVRRHGWRLPVGYDHDGAVANVYGVAVCPTVTFARRGGEVAGTALEYLDERALSARVEALERGRPLPEAAR
jgi:AhpC/TSA family